VSRPTWDDVWMSVAKDIAQRSLCTRSQVGCVIVTRQNAVVSVGYNGPPAGMRVEGPCSGWCPRVKTGGAPASYDDCYSSHAEMNALVRGARADFEGGVMYVTRMPCYTCAKVIANSGLAWVVVHPSLDDQDREPERSELVMRKSGLLVRTYHVD